MTAKKAELEAVLANHREYNGFGSEAACKVREVLTKIALRLAPFLEAVLSVVDARRRDLAVLGQVVIIALAVVHLMKELFQVTQVRGVC